MGNYRRRGIPKRLNRSMRRKLAGLFGVVVLALVGLGLRISYINAKDGAQYKQKALKQSQQRYDSRTLPFKRGDIIDRNATVLATSEKVYNVILDCQAINYKEEYREPTLKALENVLGLDVSLIIPLLDDEKTKDSRYQVVARDISLENKKDFEKLQDISNKKISEEERKERASIKGVWFEETYKRVYPQNSLACDLLGFTYGENQADWGVEGYYNSILNGTNGRTYGYFNEDDALEQTIIRPEDGKSLQLSLDASIQQTIESRANEFILAMSANGQKAAKNIGVIIQNPNNGEILGMYSSDGFDLNNPGDLSAYYSPEDLAAMSEEQKTELRLSMWQNYCISSSYEPGSTVKPLTVASALEDASLTGEETFECDGYQVVGGRTIKCSNVHGHGTQTISDAIKNSCNDALMQIAEKLGPKELIKYEKMFNFGSRTGIDLPGEAGGILYNEASMNETELATASFGQGFTCTMIQEISAISASINGGYYYQPRVVNKVLNDEGAVVKNQEKILKSQVISKSTSDLVRQYMQQSMDAGTGIFGKVAGYSGGCKTGTAQKIPRGNGKYLVSFIGFWPMENPKVTIYVVVDEPNATDQADSIYAQYLGRTIMTDVLPYMNIFPDEEDAKKSEIPDEQVYRLSPFMYPAYGFAIPESQPPTETEVDPTTVEANKEAVEDMNLPTPIESEEEITDNKLETEGVTNEGF